MSQPSDIGPAASTAPPSPASEPQSWPDALGTLVSSRLALIQLESKEVAGTWGRRAVLFAVVGVCCLFAWALILAGVVALVAEATGWPWSWVAIGAALLHLIVAIICAQLAKAPASPVFPITRAEFEKDREWIENLRKPTKSGV